MVRQLDTGDSQHEFHELFRRKRITRWDELARCLPLSLTTESSTRCHQFGRRTIGKENDFMSQNNGLAKRSEKGLLTPDNCVVAFIDHQPQMLFGTSNFDRQSIINSTVALA